MMLRSHFLTNWRRKRFYFSGMAVCVCRFIKFKEQTVFVSKLNTYCCSTDQIQVCLNILSHCRHIEIMTPWTQLSWLWGLLTINSQTAMSVERALYTRRSLPEYDPSKSLKVHKSAPYPRPLFFKIDVPSFLF